MNFKCKTLCYFPMLFKFSSINFSGGGGGGNLYIVIRGCTINLGTFLGHFQFFWYLFGLFHDFGGSFFGKI